MKILNKLKERLYNYVDYRTDELLYRTEYQIKSAFMQHYALNSKESGVSDTIYDSGKQLIVSLTTYDKRLYEVYLTIESIFQQTVKPNKVILWLADDMQNIPIPQTLKNQQKRGLEIRFCKDIRSYKKLIPTLQAYPNDIIITVDDDVIYSPDTIELLYNSYLSDSDCVHCNFAREIGIKDGGIMPYTSWKTVTENNFKSKTVFPVGCGGVLYPPHILAEEVMDDTVFMDICKLADDVWFKAMSLKNGHECKTTLLNVHEHLYIDNPMWQSKGLTLTNANQGYNDLQIKSVFSRFNINI